MMGTTVQWRQFEFFDRETVVDNADPAKVPAWLQTTEITACTGGRGSLFFADIKGHIHIVNSGMSVIYSYQAYTQKVTHIKLLKSRNIMVTIGDDEGGIPVLKVWNLDKMDKTTRAPVLTRATKIQHANKVFPVTAFAVLQNMSQIAIGLENGIVMLIRGDISRDRSTKIKVVHEGSEPVTGLGFYEDGKNVALYITTLAKVVLAYTSNKDSSVTLEEKGTEYNCAITTPSDQNQQLVVGRKEAVYFYGPDGRGPCFIIDSDKVSITWFRNYLAVVSREQRPPKTIDEAEAAGMSDQVEAPGTILTLYDLKNKYVAYTGTFGGEIEMTTNAAGKGTLGRKPVAIKHILSEWNQLFVITADKKLYKLDEMDLTTKLDILYKKNMFSLAIVIATTIPEAVISLEDSATSDLAKIPGALEFDQQLVMDIYKRYGDFLYAKGDYDAAINQYIHTIGQLEPSYIIRKFLDAQRIHNLASYLQSLHESNLANADHTTLLINCYTKLKDMKRLDEFIKKDGYAFDVETAIRVCRQAGYYEHALWLAKKFQEHDWYMHIQVEDLLKFEDTVKYVSELTPREQEKELKKYGYILARQLPGDVTDLLVKLCLTFPDPVVSNENDTSTETTTDSLRSSSVTESKIVYPEEFTHLYVNDSLWCIKFLERVLDLRWGVSSIKGKRSAAAAGPNRAVLSDLATDKEREAKSLVAVCNTLLELYLSLPPGAEGEGALGSQETVTDRTPKLSRANQGVTSPSRRANNALETMTKEAGEARALALLKDEKAKYDLDHALILCQRYNFKDGTIFVYERLKMYGEVLNFYMREENYPAVISTCKLYGDTDPSLWPQALSYFAERSTGQLGVQAHSELSEVLDVIDKRNLMPPIQVLRILSRNPAVTVGMVREYVLRKLRAENDAIEEAKKLTEAYRADTARMKAQIEEMKTSPTVFQESKCSACNQLLELPTIHFMCRHSYHARCVSERGQGSECPRCAPEHRMLVEMLESQQSTADRYDVFKSKLDQSNNRFATMAEFFSKNIFGSNKAEE
ncbi:Vacuolar protein sorting-associated protein 11 [Chytridiales sp. JEL 0842]|nr:Vacuolar protein sorting-associated protein 11 [Chytridiales sp. JEL 0842]